MTRIVLAGCIAAVALPSLSACAYYPTRREVRKEQKREARQAERAQDAGY